MTAVSLTSTIGLRRTRGVLAFGLLVGLGLLLATMLLSVLFGAADIGPSEVLAALLHPNDSTEHLIIRTLRVPRAVVAALVGGALAVAGAIMQGITRNPLASTDLLGINAGAAFGVVVAVYLLGVSSLLVYAWFALAGALLAAALVYLLGSLGGGAPTPMRLTLAGAALTALLGSLTTAVLLLDQRTLEQVRFWLAGSVAGRDLHLMLQSLPYIGFGLVLALLLGGQITLQTLGEEVASGLGQRTTLVKALSTLAVVMLAGGAVAVAGPVGFVGLVIPHVVRFFVGVDYRWVLPYCALAGGMFLVLSDVAARMVLRPQELPVGVMTAIIGGPCFVYLVRWKVRR